MILHLLDYFNSKQIILASQSPRRSQLLTEIGLQFRTVPANCDENTVEPDGEKRALMNAVMKVEAIARQSDQFDLIIGSDTVVSYNSQIFEKPNSKAEAEWMLSQLSGTSHEVITGVCLKFKKQEVKFSEKTTVQFFQLQKPFITLYIDSGEPMDKAGAYGIQGTGASFVHSISGCFYNVMGLPVSRICQELMNAYSGRLI
ncbi:MAG: septum formation protein Maf [Calditrichaeota bacterium]|nr:septum formation protein Maf [Calditrichota bacterium]